MADILLLYIESLGAEMEVGRFIIHHTSRVTQWWSSSSRIGQLPCTSFVASSHIRSMTSLCSLPLVNADCVTQTSFHLLRGVFPPVIGNRYVCAFQHFFNTGKYMQFFSNEVPQKYNKKSVHPSPHKNIIPSPISPQLTLRLHYGLANQAHKLNLWSC